MSHLRTCTVQIKNVNEQTLKEAIEFLAKELNQNVVTEIGSQFYSARQNVVAGLSSLQLGVRVTADKAIEVLGDDYHKSMTLEAFGKKVNQVYSLVNARKQLKKQGYYGLAIKHDAKTDVYQLVGNRM